MQEADERAERNAKKLEREREDISEQFEPIKVKFGQQEIQIKKMKREGYFNNLNLKYQASLSCLKKR